jgi:guanine deaminase
MDNPEFCPKYYRDASAEDSLLATKETIAHINSIDPTGELINPILTPRFAPSCTRPSLEALGALAVSHSPPLHIQTHISENTNEVTLVNDLFPEAGSYAGVYDQYNLLTPRTILAHAVHLTPEEKALIKKRDAKISHCPASNSALGSGIAPVRSFIDMGITVGLGTDVSGGYSPSILEAARQACLASRLLGHTGAFERAFVCGHGHGNGNAKDTDEDEKKKKKEIEEEAARVKLSVPESLYLATRGGAAVVDMADQIGGFDLGMLWDVQLIQLGGVKMLEESPLDRDCGEGRVDLVRPGPVGNVDLFGTETWEEKVQKWVWGGDDRNVRAVWVAGRLVHERV